MTHYSLTVPSLKETRAQMMTCLYFTAGYIDLIKANKGIGDYSTIAIVNENTLNELIEKIPARGLNGELKLEPPEICTLYVCYDLMNKLLLTSIGETLSKVALETLPHNHPLKDFTGFRFFMIKMNRELMYEIENKMPDLDGLLEKKKLLATFGLK